jgi:hypothetical protein
MPHLIMGVRILLAAMERKVATAERREEGSQRAAMMTATKHLSSRSHSESGNY